MDSPEMIRTRGDGIDIQLALWKGEGRAILCVHGLTANCRCWDTMAASLAPRHKLIALDLRGRGLSEKPTEGYYVEQHCRDIGAVIENLGIERPILMGHSLGALIALVFTALRPEQTSGLVLVDGAGCLTEEQLEKVLTGIKPALDRLGLVFPSFDAYTARLKQAPFLNPWSEALECYFRYEIEEVPDGVRSRVRPEHIREEIENLEEIDAADFYPRVRCPVLILHATEGTLSPDDRVLPESAVQRMLKEIPDARCVPVDGTNHYSILFQPSPTRDDAVDHFLTELNK
ncbi:MAG: alpha/beta hydrolase [Desulfobacterales bacterium]|nr:alpha/beta hydrolase [Desulfobacterales bacterium]